MFIFPWYIVVERKQWLPNISKRNSILHFGLTRSSFSVSGVIEKWVLPVISEVRGITGVVLVFFPSSVFVHRFLLSSVSPSFTPLVLDNRPEKNSHPSSALGMCAESMLLHVPNPIYLQHDQQSGKWSPISRDIITHGSSLRPHSVQLSMEPEPTHPSLPSYCVCACMSDFAKRQHINLFVFFSPH